jgi:transcriptional antiterminator
MAESNIYQLKYLVIPNFIYSDNRLNGTELRVASFIYSYTGKKFFFSNESLAKMFGVSSQTISNSIKKLVEYRYIEANYQIKSGGGKIRFITRLKENLKSEYKTSYSRTIKPLIGKDNKVKGNIKSNNIYGSLKYLDKLPDKDIEEFKDKYNLSESKIKDEAERAANWCRAKGRKYKNYKFFLRNWLSSPYQNNGERKKQFDRENVSKYDKYG